jgi:prepilin signal peptidase PulO-like enzyme (type II secretory pathway)
MVITYVLLGVSSVYILVEDVRFQHIPLKGLALFFGASLLKQFWEPELEGVWVVLSLAIILLSCYGLFSFFKCKSVIGTGDLLLGPSCGLWFHFSELPAFLVMTGLLGLILGVYWRYRWEMITFPFAPALLFGLGITLIMRCF